jgi:hypothetical protein
MNIIFKLVPWFIGLVFVLVVGWYIVLGVIGYKAVGLLKSEGGDKQAIEKDWDGGAK